MPSEIELLENVELRLALADSDEKFQSALERFLVPVLLKLDSPDAVVKNKVVSICSHCNSRLKSTPTIQLPCIAIAGLWSNQSLGALLRNFALIYLEMGLKRMDCAKAFAILPTIMPGISKANPLQQMSLFHIILPILATVKEVEFEKLGEGITPNNPCRMEYNDAVWLLEIMAELMRFQIISMTPTPAPATSVYSPAAVASVDNFRVRSPDVSPPEIDCGVSTKTLDFLSYKGKCDWTKSSAALKEVKVGMLKLFASTSFLPTAEIGKSAVEISVLNELCFLIYLCASADSQHDVSDAGENGLKRTSLPDLESSRVVSRLFDLYLGSEQAFNPLPSAGSLVTNPAGKSADIASHVPPASSGLKTKILYFLQKSRIAAISYPHNISVALGALFVPAVIQSLPKLKLAGMTFVKWILRMMDEPSLISQLTPLFAEAFSIIMESDDEKFYCFAVDGLGILFKKQPSYFHGRLDLLFSLFDELKTAPKTKMLAIQGALSAMITVVQNSTPMVKSEIQQMLVKNIKSQEQRVRFLTLKFTNSLFSFSDPQSRMLNLLTADDTKPEIVEECRRGLSFPSLTENESLPDFHDMCSFVSTTLNELKVGSVDIWSASIKFLRDLLVHLAEPGVSETESGLAFGMSKITSESTREAIKAWTSMHRSALPPYLDLLKQALNLPQSNIALSALVSFGLVEVCSFCEDGIVNVDVDWVLSFLSAPTETREHMGNIAGILFTAPSPSNAQNLVKTVDFLLTKKEGRENMFSRDGATYTIGCLLGRSLYRYKSEVTSVIPVELFQKGLLHLCSELLTTSPQAAISAIAEAGRYHPLPIEHGEASVPGALEVKIDSVASQKPWTIQRLYETLQSLAKDSKHQEGVIRTLGHLACGDERFVQLSFNFFMSLSTFVKAVDVHFSIGEAVSACLCGFDATCMQVNLDVVSVSSPAHKSPGAKRKFIDQIMGDLQPGKASLLTRKGLVVWLLSLVKFCHRAELVKSALLQIHAAFSISLADRDEFIQEVASKGIGLVYELGDANLKRELVDSLVRTFTAGKKIDVQSVTADTQLFNENALGSSPDGNSISTYQSILSLASDMNQPDLVYRFMSLASSNAIWNSRKGASMGFGTIAKHAQEQLRPYLPTLIPKLYKYQFDPNPKVGDSMKSIWKSLVPDTKTALTDYFDVILKEILIGLGDRGWRVREGCCAALSDILHGTSADQVSPHIVELWTMCFRTLDDIKESVRLAAFNATKTLTNLTLHFVDAEFPDLIRGQAILDSVLPFFLTRGIQSKAQEVAQFSIITILKMCKKSGHYLKPHLESVIGELLESLSTLESRSLNYLSFHVDQATLGMLESSRSSAVRMSPIFVGIEAAADQTDVNTLKTLVPRCLQIIRKGVGLPTKVGVARFMYSLVSRFPRDLEPYAEDLLKALSGAVQDRSPEIRASFANAISHVMKVAPHASAVKLVAFLRKSYLENDSGSGNDDTVKSVSALVCLEMAKHAPDQCKAVLADLVPLAFIGSKDPDEAFAKPWVLVWNELTGSASGAMRLWLNEILALCEDLIKNTSSWIVKRQVSNAVGDVVKAVGALAFEPYASSFLGYLMDACAGRTWDGKEDVLSALACVVQEMRTWVLVNNMADKVVEVFIREAKKRNIKYKRISILLLGQVIQALKLQRQHYGQVKEFLMEEASSVPSPDYMDEDDPKDRPLRLLIRANAFKTLGMCWSDSGSNALTNSGRSGSETTEIIELLTTNLHGNVWNIRSTVLETLLVILKSVYGDGKEADVLAHQVPVPFDLAKRTCLALLQCLEDGKFNVIRTGSIACLKVTLPLLLSYDEMRGPDAQSFYDQVAKSLASFQSHENVPAIEEEIRAVASLWKQLDVMRLDG